MNTKASKICCWVCAVVAVLSLIAGIILVAAGLQSSEGVEGGLFICGVMLLIFAVAFGICAFSVKVGARNQQSRHVAITSFMQQYAGENALYLTGTYTKQGEKGKAAAKTAASIAGGVLGALFLGVGAYKVYNSEIPMGYILSDNGLFIFNQNEPFVRENITFFPKGSFHDSIVTVKSNKVLLTEQQTKQIFTLNITNKEVTAEQVGARLKALLEEEVKSSPDSAENQAAPFEEFDFSSRNESAAASGSLGADEEDVANLPHEN